MFMEKRPADTKKLCLHPMVMTRDLAAFARSAEQERERGDVLKE